jgi:hypothetical protein
MLFNIDDVKATTIPDEGPEAKGWLQLAAAGAQLLLTARTAGLLHWSITSTSCFERIMNCSLVMRQSAVNCGCCA